jgi:flavodoxin
MENEREKHTELISMKSLLVLYSYHYYNTEKIAKIIAEVLDADIKWLQEINLKRNSRMI